MPELPEVEVMGRVLSAAVRASTIESTLAPGVNALKTFDPPLHALDGATIAGLRRRGKLLLLDADHASRGHLSLVMHLMSAGRLQTLGGLRAAQTLRGLGPEAWRAPPADLADRLAAQGARPLHSVLRDQH